MSINYKEIGKRIKQYRMELNITQAQLGERADVEPSNISHIERGATKLSLPTLVKIANALGKTTDELLYDSLKPRRTVLLGELDELLSGCSDTQIRLMLDVMRSVKNAMLNGEANEK